jgi:hypothetical protein
MRALTLLFTAFAAAAPAPKPVLEVSVQLHHSRQWTKVYDGQDGWYCATEHNPMYPLAAKPGFLALVKSQDTPKGTCRENLSARLNEGKDARTWLACLSDQDAAKFKRALDKTCGRF